MMKVACGPLFHSSVLTATPMTTYDFLEFTCTLVSGLLKSGFATYVENSMVLDVKRSLKIIGKRSQVLVR